jgi:uncharacterized protein
MLTAAISASSPALAVDWSPRLNDIGVVVEGLADIEQCIGVILRTPLGSDPHRPDFGADITPYIDQPEAACLPGLIRAATDALRRWEARIEVIRVAPHRLTAEQKALGRLALRVEWRLKGGTAVMTTEATL